VFKLLRYCDTLIAHGSFILSLFIYFIFQKLFKCDRITKNNPSYFIPKLNCFLFNQYVSFVVFYLFSKENKKETSLECEQYIIKQ